MHDVAEFSTHAVADRRERRSRAGFSVRDQGSDGAPDENAEACADHRGQGEDADDSADRPGAVEGDECDGEGRSLFSALGDSHGGRSEDHEAERGHSRRHREPRDGKDGAQWPRGDDPAEGDTESDESRQPDELTLDIGAVRSGVIRLGVICVALSESDSFDPGPPDRAVATRRAASACIEIATVTRISKIPTRAPKAPKSSGPRTRAATMLSKKAAPLPTMVATPTRIRPLASAERDSCSTGVTLLA